jgi:predicted metal-dependent peptidase
MGEQYGIEPEIIEMVLQRKFFMGHILQQFRRVPVTKDMMEYKVIRTLGVNITDDMKPNLYYNVDFFNTGDGKTWGLSRDERIAVLEHEVLHILNKHLVRTEGRNHYIFNVANDLAINQFIEHLPSGGGLCPDCNIYVRKTENGQFRTKCPKCGIDLNPDVNKFDCLDINNFTLDGKKMPLERDRASEIYYNAIWAKVPKEVVEIGVQMTDKKEANARENIPNGQPQQGQGQPQQGGQQGQGQQQGQQGSGGQNGQPQPQGQGQGQEQGDGRGVGVGIVKIGGVEIPLPMDAHEAWDAGSGNHEMAHEKIKDMVRKAIENAPDRSQGSQPGWLQKLISECLAHKTVNWKTELRRFYGFAEFARYIPTRKRLNRRFDLMPGYKVERKAHFVVAADSSGSVSDDEFAKFFREIDVMRSHAKISITLVECDAAITHVEDYKSRPKKGVKRYGYGGTDFTPVFDFVEKGIWKGGAKNGGDYKLKTKVDGIIYLTDGAGNYPHKLPTGITANQVIWVMTKQHSDYGWSAKVGRKIVMED